MRAMLGTVDESYLLSILQALVERRCRRMLPTADEMQVRGFILNPRCRILRRCSIRLPCCRLCLLRVADEFDRKQVLAASTAPRTSSSTIRIALQGRSETSLRHPTNTQVPPCRCCVCSRSRRKGRRRASNRRTHRRPGDERRCATRVGRGAEKPQTESAASQPEGTRPMARSRVQPQDWGYGAHARATQRVDARGRRPGSSSSFRKRTQPPPDAGVCDELNPLKNDMGASSCNSRLAKHR